MNFYSIYDCKVMTYGPPITAHNHAAAIRAFENHVKTEGTEPNKHPGDFTLWYSGYFDIETGKINATQPTEICRALDFVAGTPMKAVNDE